MNKKWSDYYKNIKTNKLNIYLHFQYILLIIFLNPKKIIEIGCGSGDHSIFIKKLFKKKIISFLDNDKDILENAYKKYSSNVQNFYYADILNKEKINKIEYHDIAMSQGLMEHFSDKDFIKIIENFRGKVNYFIFSIPSNYYPTIDFGNEILRSKREVEFLLHKISNIEFKVINYFDIGFRTKINGLKKFNNLSSKLLYFFKSNHLLIKIKYL